MSEAMIYEILIASGETLYMVILGTFIAMLLGLPLGVFLFLYKRVSPHRGIYRSLSGLINIVRSIPFIILVLALIPLTRIIAGTSIGTNAALVPLTLGATPLFARMSENVLQSLPLGLLDAARAMGATRWQMIQMILLPEALPGLINTTTVTAITLVNYSAMAGAVGGGGLGDLAIRYGYQRFDLNVMLITVVLLILMVQLIQQLGDYFAKKMTH